jgi:hypothetical protein
MGWAMVVFVGINNAPHKVAHVKKARLGCMAQS